MRLAVKPQRMRVFRLRWRMIWRASPWKSEFFSEPPTIKKRGCWKDLRAAMQVSGVVEKESL